MISGMPSTAVASTGTDDASPSIRVFGNASNRDGWMQTSIASNMAETSGRYPVKITLSPRGAASRASSDAQGP